MVNINFYTTAITSGTQYEITDTSTNYSTGYDHKNVIVKAMDGTVLFSEYTAPLSKLVFTANIDSNWNSHLALIVVLVQIEYKISGGATDSLEKRYYLPTITNLEI